MGVVVTRKPGGIAQLYNTDTGKVTYKCKGDGAFMLIEAFGGIVQFNKKGAKATVSGKVTTLDSCDVIKEGDIKYKEALSAVIQSQKEFAKEKSDAMQREIKKLEEKFESLTSAKSC